MSILNEQTFTNSADTRKLVDEVVEYAKQSVCSTMGPEGQYVVINNNNKPLVTKDGVSVAKALDFNEPRRNLIANIIMEPSIKTDQEVGDGTTTTVFMMEAFYSKFKDQMTFRGIRYLDGLVERTRKILNDMVIPGDVHSERFRKMLMTTSNYETEIVDTVLKIYREYDNPNIILREVPSLPEDTVETNTQVYVPGGYAADEFTPRTNADGIRALDGVDGYRVVVIDHHFSNVDAGKLAQLVLEDKSVPYQKPIVIFARNFDPVVLTILKNQIQQLGVNIIPFRIDAGGSIGAGVVRDLCEILGTTAISDMSGITETQLKEIHVPMVLGPRAVFFDRKENEHIDQVCDVIVSELQARYDQMTVIDRQTPIGLILMDRISRLSGSNVIIKVTGTVPSEAKERYYRFEDAIKAAKTGKIFGVLPGIGCGYLGAAKILFMERDPKDAFEEKLLMDFIEVLESPYKHLTGQNDYQTKNQKPAQFLDLVTGEVSERVDNVFDNAAATMTALSGGWSTAKTLAKLNNIMGRSMKQYTK